MDLHRSSPKTNNESDPPDAPELIPRRRSSRLSMKKSSSSEPKDKEVLNFLPPDIQALKERNAEKQKPSKNQPSKTIEIQNDNDLKKFDIDLSNIHENANFEDSFIFEQKPARENKVPKKVKPVEPNLLNYLAPQNFKTAIPAPNEAVKIMPKPNLAIKKVTLTEQPIPITANQATIMPEPNPTSQKRPEPVVSLLPQSKLPSPQKTALAEQRVQFPPIESTEISANNTSSDFPFNIFNSTAVSKVNQSKEPVQSQIAQNSPPKESRKKNSRRFSDRFKKILNEEPILIPISSNSDNPFHKTFQEAPLILNEESARPTIKTNVSKESSPLGNFWTSQAIENKITTTGFESKGKSSRIEPGNQQYGGFISMSPLNKTMIDASMLSEVVYSPNANTNNGKQSLKKANEASTSKNLIILDYDPNEDKPASKTVEDRPYTTRIDVSDRTVDLPAKQTTRNRIQQGALDQIFQTILGSEEIQEKNQEHQPEMETTVIKKINNGFNNLLVEEQASSKLKPSIIEEAVGQQRDYFAPTDSQNLHHSIPTIKNQNKPSILSFIQEEKVVPSDEVRMQLNSFKPSPNKNDGNPPSNQVNEKAISLGPNQLIIGSRQKRSTGNTQEYFKKVYQDELNNVLSQHLRIDDESHPADSRSKQPTLSQIIQKAIQILDEFYHETEKLSFEDQNNTLNEFCSNVTFNGRTRENLLRQYIFNKIIFALKRSSKISFYKNLSHRIDRTFEDLYSVLAEKPKRKHAVQTLPTTASGRTSSFLSTVFSLKVIKVVMSEDGKNIVYNLQFQDNLSLVFKTEPNSKKIIFLQVFLVKIPLLLRERIKDKNSVTDLIIRNFQDRVSNGFSLELFDSLNFICTCYHNFISLYEYLEQMLIDKLIQEYSVDKEGRFSVRVRLPKMPFFEVQFLIWMSSYFSSNISYQLKNLDTNFQKIFTSSIKSFIKNLNETIKTHFINSYAPIAPRVLKLFKLMHRMSLFEKKDLIDASGEGKENDIEVTQAKEKARSATNKSFESLKNVETIEIAD